MSLLTEHYCMVTMVTRYGASDETNSMTLKLGFQGQITKKYAKTDDLTLKMNVKVTDFFPIRCAALRYPLSHTLIVHKYYLDICLDECLLKLIYT